jgi:hypothetical protein
MFNIEKFLEKFSKGLKAGELHAETILGEIAAQTGIQLEKKDIEVRNYILHIKASPAVKNKIFIFKEAILTGLNSKIEPKIIDIK